MSRLAILLPAAIDDPVEWVAIADGVVVAGGTDGDWSRASEGATRATLVVPAAAVSLHRALLPDLAPRQAQAAARLMAVENALGVPAELHVAAGPRDPDGALDVAVVANADMVAWLAWADAHALDAVAMVPAPLLLPRPDAGFVRGQVGSETIARDKSAAFALDETMAELLIGDAAVGDVTPAEVATALVAALDTPPLDLRQGMFARRQRRVIDRGLVQRASVLAGLILAINLAIALIAIVKLNADTARLNDGALAAARSVIPATASVEQAESALDARAAALGVGGRGFASTAARLFAALDQSPSVTLTTFDVAADGTVRATLAAPAVNDLDVAVAALRSSGAGAVTTPSPTGDGRQAVQLTMTPQ